MLIYDKFTHTIHAVTNMDEAFSTYTRIMAAAERRQATVNWDNVFKDLYYGLSVMEDELNKSSIIVTAVTIG